MTRLTLFGVGAIAISCTVVTGGGPDPAATLDPSDDGEGDSGDGGGSGEDDGGDGGDAPADDAPADDGVASSGDDAETGGDESGDAEASGDDAPADEGGDPTDPVFANGWENRDELGCTLEGLLDGPGGASANSWGDFGPAFASTCAEPPMAEIVEDEFHSGSRSLRVEFPPDGTQNGPDFRIAQDFAAQTETYARAWVKYSDNWVWAGADHKILIFGVSGGAPTQDIYINVRGLGDGGPGYIAVHSIPADTVFEDHASNVFPGEWHYIEAHIVSGESGAIEVRLDGELLDLVDQGSNAYDPLDVPTGSVIEYIKVDTTYNDYAYPSGLGLTMHTWFDDVAVFAGSW
jgi:hypothetical protein